MYVTTFYSYKGGVGRTMALINVASLLAKEGKRVLLVDFDLEAPGIPSFDLFQAAGKRPGIVDYVCAFRDSGKAPDVADFIVECGGDDKPSIWLMPAGRHTQAGYAEKLYSIDWKDLYDNHDGFLMFEDMRFQWERHPANFDYVLIDSRTGHTDVGGICTRQLPDSVVVMFLPNAQNIEGLKPIVAAIREEKVLIRGHQIDLHFCPSNVPDLDDEDDILSDMLNLAKANLGRDVTVINHYQSLELLKQPAFVACRPNSKLSRQYNNLKSAIIALNYGDEAGAEVALKAMPERYERARMEGDQVTLSDIESTVARISAHHPESGRIGWYLSILYSRMGAIEDEIGALTLSIERDYERGRAIIRRARLLSSLDRKDSARTDLHRLLSSGTATVFEILPAIDLLKAIDPTGWVTPIQTAIEQLQLSGRTYRMLLPTLMSERDKLPLALRLSQRTLEAGAIDDNDRVVIRAHLILTFIGLGRFQVAMDMITDDRSKLLASTRPDDVFNYAVAEWGLDGVPPKDLFARVLEVTRGSSFVLDANLCQCRAMAEMVLGDKEAAYQNIEAARSRARNGVRDFSCWRFLETTGRAMLADLAAMSEALGHDASPEPAFFDEVRRLVD